MFDIIHPDDRDSCKILFERILSGEPVENIETVFAAKDGRKVIVSGNINCRFEDGKPVATRGIFRNVTEIKRAEEDLRLKTALLEAESETTLDGILAVDNANLTILRNQQFVRMWDVPEAILAEHDDTKALQYAVSQTENPAAFLERIDYLYQHPDEKAQDEIRLKNGKVFDRYSSPLIGASGEHYGRIWYFRDVTEHRRAEQALWPWVWLSPVTFLPLFLNRSMAAVDKTKRECNCGNAPVQVRREGFGELNKRARKEGRLAFRYWDPAPSVTRI